MFIVKYTESERGWGGEVWFTEYDTKEKAENAVFICNKNNPELTPDYYIVASYFGEHDSVPEGYKF